MKELGKFLKKEREKLGLSLDDIASRTKIHVQKISDIEEGRKDKLPAKVFCIGLIKSYARELRVDMDQVNNLIAEAFKEPKQETPEPTVEQPATKKPNDSEENNQMVGLFKVPKFVMIGASLALSLILIFVIFQVVEKMNSYSEEEALPEEVFISQGDPNSDKSDEESGDTISENSVSVKENPQPSSEKIEKIAQEPSQTKLDEVKRSKPLREDETITKAPIEPVEISNGDFNEDNFGETPTNKPADVISDNKLTLTALEPVRAEVVWSDGYVQVMLLKSKETKTLVFSQPITLRVNNGGAIQVSFNDAEKSVPGTFNKPIEIQYP